MLPRFVSRVSPPPMPQMSGIECRVYDDCRSQFPKSKVAVLNFVQLIFIFLWIDVLIY